MPFNGSGTFTRLYSWSQDASNGIKISSSRTDAETDGIATGLSTCLTKDGQTTPTANIPMGSFRITSLGDATARTDGAKVSQVQDGAYLKLGSVSGTNTIAASLTPAITAYVAGLSVELTPANTITASATLNINGVGALTLKKSIGGALVALVQNDLIAGVPARITLYDATTPVLMNPQTYSHGADVASAGTINLDTATGDCVDVTGTTTITAVTLSEGRCCTVRFTGALTLTNGASLVLPGGASITTVAGDYAIFRGYASGVVRCVTYTTSAGGSAQRILTRTASTSGTAVSFTGIPSWARRITLNLEGISTTGNSDVIIQVGASGGYQSTGYTGCSSSMTGAGTGGAKDLTSGFILDSAAVAAMILSGSVVLTLSDSANGVWCATGVTGRSDLTRTTSVGGHKSLSGVLDRIQVTTAGGANTFDAGAISVLVE